MEINIENINLKDRLKDINIEIPIGKTTGIIGNNGSGKTSLLEVLSLNIKTPGNITIKGKQLEKNKIGYLSQDIDTNFKKDTVISELQNVLEENNYPKTKQEKRKKDVLTMVNLTDYENRKINTLSNSEKKLLKIACVLIHNPKILILDEPFECLDNNEINNILKIIRLLKYRYKKTIIIASNQTDLLHKLSDKIIVMDKGKVIKEGDKYSVFEKDNLTKIGIDIPKVIKFSDTVKSKKKINLGYRDEINDLIKDIYRFIK